MTATCAVLDETQPELASERKEAMQNEAEAMKQEADGEQ